MIRGLAARLPNRIRRIYPPSEVTRVAAEVEPESVGLRRVDLEAIWAAVVRYYELGLQPSMAVCIRRRGQVVLDRAIGHARGNGPGEDEPLVGATPDTLYNLFSGSKSITAMLIHQLEHEGALHLDHPIARYIPEFARHDKEWVTIRHILSHRAGIPAVSGDVLDLDVLGDRERMVRILADARPDTAPGHQLAYHAVTGGFVLGELIERVTGEPIRERLARTVLRPLGFAHGGYGVPTADLPRVAKESFTGPRPPKGLGRMLERSLGLEIERVVELANDARFLTSVVPSGNIIGTAREIGRLFELFLRWGALDGVRVFAPAAIRRAVREQSYLEIDRVIMLPVRYGLGFMLGSEHIGFFGPSSSKAFGHLGFTNVLAWADAERDISVAFMNNGKPFVTPELVMWLRIMRVIAARIPRDTDASDWP